MAGVEDAGDGAQAGVGGIRRSLQIAVLINPMVYMSEGLRAVLTPELGHMPMWAVLLALVGGTVVFGYLGSRAFIRRVLN